MNLRPFEECTDHFQHSFLNIYCFMHIANFGDVILNRDKTYVTDSVDSQDKLAILAWLSLKRRNIFIMALLCQNKFDESVKDKWSD